MQLSLDKGLYGEMVRMLRIANSHGKLSGDDEGAAASNACRGVKKCGV